MPENLYQLTPKRIAIAIVLCLLFPPLLVVVIPLGIFAWIKRRNTQTGTGGPKPTGSRPVTDIVKAPFPPPERNFKFNVFRADAFIRDCLGISDNDVAVDPEFVNENGDNSFWLMSISQETARRAGIVQLFVTPYGIQVFEIDKDALQPGTLPQVDLLFENDSAFRGTGGDMGDENALDFDLRDGSGFAINQIESGARADKNGVRIFFKAKGTDNIGNPQRHEDVPFLYVAFQLGEREGAYLAAFENGKPEWAFDEVFFPEMGIVDLAGEIGFAAQIVHHRGNELTAESLVPLSPVVRGVVKARSKNMPV